MCVVQRNRRAYKSTGWCCVRCFSLIRRLRIFSCARRCNPTPDKHQRAMLQTVRIPFVNVGHVFARFGLTRVAARPFETTTSPALEWITVMGTHHGKDSLGEATSAMSACMAGLPRATTERGMNERPLVFLWAVVAARFLCSPFFSLWGIVSVRGNGEPDLVDCV